MAHIQQIDKMNKSQEWVKGNKSGWKTPAEKYAESNPMSLEYDGRISPKIEKYSDIGDGLTLKKLPSTK